MDDQVVEEDPYSDDDLDALPVDAFHQLQEDAFKSTQHQRDHVPFREPELPAAISKEARKVYGRPTFIPDINNPQNGPQHPSSDYGDFEDEMLDGEIYDGAAQTPLPVTYQKISARKEPGESTQREQWRQQRYSAPLAASTRTPSLPQPQVNGNARARGLTSNVAAKSLAARDLSTTAENESEGATDLGSLQRQLNVLRQECQALRAANETANQNFFAKSGEIAIVRANAVKVERELDGRTKALQKLHADETAKQRVEIERARAEIQKLATEKEFLQNDLAEGAKQIKHLQLAAKKGGEQGGLTKAGRKTSPVTTPRKNKLPYGDGFDDNEVQPLSPSELVLRGKGSTPKAGAKRKRKINDPSPVKHLQLGQPSTKEALDPSEKPTAILDKAIPHRGRPQPDVKFSFIQKLLGHRLAPGSERTIEALSNFKLPSQSGKPLATVLYDRILALGAGPAENVPAAVGLIVISLWSQCIHEHFHDPVHLLIDLVKFILILNPIKTAPEFTNSLMELIQETADIVIIPRCQKKPARNDAADISSLECLYVMQMMAQDCSVDSEEIIRFWRTIRFDFIMMLLSFVHPLGEIRATISLLQSSVLENTFAMIIPPGDGRQDATEARIIDNLSRLLVEAPRPAQGEPFLDAVQLSELRLAVLDLMDSMCERKYGAEALAKHRLVIGRLVRVMNDELDRAYDYQYGHEKRIDLVNASTRLLYFLTSNYGDLINMQVRLSVIPGGEKKYLITLTRLAFSEGGYLEAGIEDDVVEQAHQMLEARVSPEEAEQLVEAFASAQSSRKESREAV